MSPVEKKNTLLATVEKAEKIPAAKDLSKKPKDLTPEFQNEVKKLLASLSEDIETDENLDDDVKLRRTNAIEKLTAILELPPAPEVPETPAEKAA